MSQNLEISTTLNTSKERIIPIKVEKDELSYEDHQKVSSSLKPNITLEKTNKEIDTAKGDSNDSDSICSSVESLTLTATSIPGNEISALHVPLTETEINIPQRTLPSSNVPERIIIVLDRALDEDCTNFTIMSGKKYPPLFMIQHAVKLFLHNKASMNDQHEFALVVLNENSASWVYNFTSVVQDIVDAMHTIEPCDPEDIFNLNSVFDLITNRMELDMPKENLLIPPTFVVRTVLLYGRSYSIPKLKKTNEIKELLESPYFTFDVVMTHDPPNSANNCTKIFKLLQEIDTKGYGYSFSVSRNASGLHLAMAKILSHPLQRVHQLNAKYDINLASN